MKKVQFYFAGSITIILAGCASLHTTTNQTNSYSQTQATSQAWKVNKILLDQKLMAHGIIGVISPKERISTTFEFAQYGKLNYSLSFTPPLTGIVAKLIRTPNKITYNDGKRYIESKDPAQLTNKILNISLPLDKLMMIAIGVSDQTAIYTLDNHTYLASQKFILDGKKISVNYSDYAIYKDFTLPTSISIVYQDTKIKLQISQWKLK